VKKGGRYVPRIHICNFFRDYGEGLDRYGRRWRWDFSEMFGPLFVDAKGEPLKVQPMSERHAAWEPFNKWYKEFSQLPKKPGGCGCANKRGS
jgi:hypothetical protein